jgi:GntR family transcriptional regulator
MRREPARPERLSVDELARIADPRVRVPAVSRAIAEHQAFLAELARLRREGVAELRASGLTQAQVAQVLGISPARAAQIEASERARRVVVERAVPTIPATRASASLYLTEAEQQGVVPSREMLYVGPVPSPAHIAALLRVAPEEPVLLRRKRMRADEIPVRIADSYFRLDVAEGTPISGTDFVEGGFQVYFDRVGRRFGRAVESFMARPATTEEAELLELEQESPTIVQVVRCSYDADDVPIHCLDTVCAADRHVFRVPQPEGDTVF